jgi:glycosyltransferase involved in cell wall biosynthesis
LKKIKILELIDGGFLGGGQTNILSIVRIIDNSAFEIHIAARGGGRFESEAKKLGIPFYALELPKVLRHKYLRKLQAVHDIEEFDIVHSHGGVGGFYGRLLKKHNQEIKSVHTIHGIHYIHSDSFFVRNASKSIEQYLVQFTDKTICETNNDFKTAIENKIAGQHNTVIIPNGIDISKYSQSEKNLNLLNQLGLSEENFIIGNISRFDFQKNQKLIIQASYYLIRKYPEMRFILAGSGKYLKRMMEYAREANLGKYVIFTGEISNPVEYYSVFDIFVLPSLWEGMPYVLLEAMASRLPIICSSIGNHLEVVKNNVSALTINPYDMDELYQKISHLYKNRESCTRLTANAFEAVQNYDERTTVKQIENLYREVSQS